MGKVRHIRRKYHATSVKNADKPVDNEIVTDTKLPTFQIDLSSSNIFKDVVIDYDALISKKLPAFDKISVKSIKNEPEKHLRKKEKRELRHQAFLKKIDLIQQMRKENKEKKKRRKNVIVGDMQPLCDALPTLDCIEKEIKAKKDRRKPKKLRSIEKKHVRQKAELKDIESFQHVLKHPSYKANPFGTILEHVKNLVEMENDKIKKKN